MIIRIAAAVCPICVCGTSERVVFGYEYVHARTLSTLAQVVEVKGPGDQLSNKQRIWLEWFTDNGFESQVCHVKSERIFAD